MLVLEFIGVLFKLISNQLPNAKRNISEVRALDLITMERSRVRVPAGALEFGIRSTPVFAVDPGHSSGKSTGGRLQPNTHAPYVCGFDEITLCTGAWLDGVHRMEASEQCANKKLIHYVRKLFQPILTVGVHINALVIKTRNALLIKLSQGLRLSFIK